MSFTGRETPREVALTLENEGYWLWDEDPYRMVYWNGEDFWKVSRFPDRPTLNHLDHHTLPTDTLFTTPNYAYMNTLSGDSLGSVYKPLSTK